METDFEYLMNSFLRIYASFNPIEAFEFGWREFAGLLPDNSAEQINSYIYFLKKTRGNLENINHDDLDKD